MRKQRILTNWKGEPITDGHGTPIVRNFTIHEGGRYGNRWGDTFDHFWHQSDKDFHKLTGPDAVKRLRSAGRFLFANSPIVRGAIMEQAAYSFPLEPMYVGKDPEWGQQAKAWLWEWKQAQDSQGYPFDSLTGSRMRLMGRKVDGDFATILKLDDDDNPRLQRIQSHRIWNRPDVRHGEVFTGGPYAGARMTMGVILNRDNAPLAYNIIGDEPGQDVQIPSSAMFNTYRPESPGQVRGVSEMCASTMSFSDLKRLREYEMRAQQIQAAISVVETNEEGEPPPGADFLTGPAADATTSNTASGLNFQTFEGGLYKYLRSNTGSGLELIRPDRPSGDSQNYEDRIITAALYGIEWDPHFALAIKEPGGAWARTTLEKVRRAIAGNQRIETACQRREDNFGLAVAVEILRVLPEPADGDITAWEYQPPARFTADSGNEENAKREAYKLGLTTLEDIDSEKGRWWEETRGKKEREIRDLLNRAQGLAGDYGITLQEATKLLEDRGGSLPVHQPEQGRAVD